MYRLGKSQVHSSTSWTDWRFIISTIFGEENKTKFWPFFDGKGN